MVGLIDDFGVLSPSQKLLGQTLAALVLIKSGTFIKLTFLPVWLAMPLTVLWILAVTNALNIIDIMDGLASGVAAIATMSIAVANFMAGRDSVAFLCIVLCGAVLGFLRHNFHPAKIYLGDAGSLFIGFMLAALSMNAGYTRANLLAVISPVLILGIPLFDLALVMWIRWSNGIPVTKGSPDHFALRLRRCKLSVRETAVTTYIVAVLLSGVALLMSQVSLGMGDRHNGRNAVVGRPVGISADESRHAFMKKVVIIGGGLAGLSAGHHLLEHEPIVFEKEPVIGGLCRSFTQDGFTFDCTGHLIHLKNPYTKELVARILPDAFNAHERLAAIYSKTDDNPVSVPGQHLWFAARSRQGVCCRLRGEHAAEAPTAIRKTFTIGFCRRSGPALRSTSCFPTTKSSGSRISGTFDATG